MSLDPTMMGSMRDQSKPKEPLGEQSGGAASQPEEAKQPVTTESNAKKEK